MGNEVSYTPEQLKHALQMDYDFMRVKSKASKMGLDIVIQGDASVTIQNPKDLKSKPVAVAAPTSIYKEDLDLTISRITMGLDELASSCGYTFFGYQ